MKAIGRAVVTGVSIAIVWSLMDWTIGSGFNYHSTIDYLSAGGLGSWLTRYD